MIKEEELTLTPKQQECVNYASEKNLLIRGIAGSGKSIVIVRRAKKIYDQAMAMGKPVSIVIYTFAGMLVDYMKEIISYGDQYADGIAVKTLDSEIQSVYKNMFNKSSLYNVYPRQQSMLNTLDDVMKSVITQDNHENRFLKLNMFEFLVDEIMWMKQHMFVEAEEYIGCIRKGRGSVHVSKRDRALIFNIYQKFYKKFDEAYPDNIDKLCENLYNNKADIPDSCKYDFVMIDEAQDLTLNKMLIAKELAKVSLTISADFAQKIYKSGFTWKEVGINFRGQAAKRLTGTHRNTYQIAALANSLSRHNTELKHMEEDDEYQPPEMPVRQGEKSVLRYTTSYDMEGREIKALSEAIINANEEFTVGILVKTNKDITKVKKWLGNTAYQILDKRNEHKVLEPGIKIVTCFSAKGLEFDVVIIPMLDADKYPQLSSDFAPYQTIDAEILEDKMNKERNLLYVAITRAREKLFMFAGDGSIRKPSPLLSELDTDFYDIM